MSNQRYLDMDPYAARDTSCPPAISPKISSTEPHPSTGYPVAPHPTRIAGSAQRQSEHGGPRKPHWVQLLTGTRQAQLLTPLGSLLVAENSQQVMPSTMTQGSTTPQKEAANCPRNAIRPPYTSLKKSHAGMPIIPLIHQMLPPLINHQFHCCTALGLCSDLSLIPLAPVLGPLNNNTSPHRP